MKIISLIVISLFSLVLSGCSVMGIQYDQSGAKSTTEPPVIINKLDLSNKQLTALPAYVVDLSNLESLDLSNNNLTGALPSQIGKLQKLKVLNLSNNAMTGIPAEVGQLIKLQILDLSNNQFTGLPTELGNLKNLKTLNLSGNNYAQPDLDNILKTLPVDVKVITQ